MPQIFSRKANVLPALSLAALGIGGVFAIVFVWYYFSPEFTDVGYAPEQPVEYSHQLHVGELGLDCQYCHTNVKNTEHSNIPATQTCMNCHRQIRPESLKLLPVRESWITGESIEWIKVHKLPDFAKFSHAIHTNTGVGCETCHGRIDEMEVVAQSEPLSMSWCLDCHRQEPTEVTSQVYRNLGHRGPTHCSACHR